MSSCVERCERERAFVGEEVVVDGCWGLRVKSDRLGVWSGEEHVGEHVHQALLVLPLQPVLAEVEVGDHLRLQRVIKCELSLTGEKVLGTDKVPVLLHHIVGRVHVLPEAGGKQSALLGGDPGHEGHHLLLLVVQDRDWVGWHERLVGVVINHHPHPVSHVARVILLKLNLFLERLGPNFHGLDALGDDVVDGQAEETALSHVLWDFLDRQVDIADPLVEGSAVFKDSFTL